MVQRIALTSVGPYVGVSTLAKRFMEHGYQYISMSDVLVRAFARQVGETPQYIAKNKAHYREALQRFGDSSGFSEVRGTWPMELFRGVNLAVPIVIEKLRTNAQAELVMAHQFDIHMLTIAWETRLTRAATFGVGEEELKRIMAHPVEQAIDSYWVDCTYPIDQQGNDTDWLVERILNREDDGC